MTPEAGDESGGVLLGWNPWSILGPQIKERLLALLLGSPGPFAWPPVLESLWRGLQGGNWALSWVGSRASFCPLLSSPR